VAEGLEPADEVAGLAGRVEMALVPVRTELSVRAVGVVEQVSGDDQADPSRTGISIRLPVAETTISGGVRRVLAGRRALHRAGFPPGLGQGATLFGDLVAVEVGRWWRTRTTPGDPRAGPGTASPLPAADRQWVSGVGALGDAFAYQPGVLEAGRREVEQTVVRDHLR
jgi:hypothetical protein